MGDGPAPVGLALDTPGLRQCPPAAMAWPAMLTVDAEPQELSFTAAHIRLAHGMELELASHTESCVSYTVPPSGLS